MCGVFTIPCNHYASIVRSFRACVEKMKTQYIGEFLYNFSVVEAAALELDRLYLKDFVAIILQPASDKEAQVRICVNIQPA